jgi:nitrilase
MAGVKIAAVQAAYTLMNQEACMDKAVKLLHQAAAEGAGIVVFPEVFIPGNPIWIDTLPIWDGDGDWYALLVEQAVVVPGPVTDTLAAAAPDTGTYLVIGVDERELHGTTIYNATLYFGPDGTLLGKHRKLMPTGSERTVWGMGDGSTLPVIDTPYGRLSGLTCWENYMPLTRFYVYSQGVDIWTAPDGTVLVGPARRRPSFTPTSISLPYGPHGGTSTRSVTATAPTSSSSTSTPPLQSSSESRHPTCQNSVDL